jgi:hypothetical protein
MRTATQTLNAQFGQDFELDVERWTLGVGRFLSR